MAKSTPSKPTHKTQKPAPLEGNRVWRERGRVRKSAPMLGEKTLWEKTPSWGQHAICLGFLLVVAVGFFASTTFGGRTLAGGDIVQWRSMAEAMIQYEESTGDDALWAPYLFGGMPGYMIKYSLKVPGADSVLRVLREWGLWPVAHFFALLVGVYLLVYLLTRHKLPGVLAAVAFGLTTYLPLILTAGHTSKFIALAFAPWLLLAFAAILYRPDDSSWARSLMLAGLFAIAAAVNLRAGHVQITYYVVIAALVWWLAEGVASIRLKRLPRFGISTALLALGAVLAIAMVAQPYLANAEYKAFTIRSSGPGGGLAWEYAMNWSQGIGELITLVVANAFGGGSGEAYWGAKPFTAGPHYVGPIVLLLAVLGVFGVARRATTGLGLAVLVMVLFALGENVPLVNRLAFELLPLFDSFRGPETWLSIVALVLAVLAGYGAYYLARREATPEAEARKTRWTYVGLGATLALLAGLYLSAGVLFDFTREGEVVQVETALARQGGVGRSDPRVQAAAAQYVEEARAERKDMLRGDAGRGVLFLLLAGAALFLYRTRRIPPWAVLAALILLVTIDLWGVGRRYFNDDSSALLARRNLAAAVPSYEYDRFIQNRVEEAGGPGHFRTLSLEGSVTQNARPAFYYESVGGYHAAKLALYQDYLDRLLFSEEGGLNENALDLMSTRYIVAQGVLPGTQPVFQDETTNMLVLENTDYLPRAFFVDSVAVIADEDSMLARLRAPDANLRRTAYLYEPVEGYAPARVDSASTATVAVERFTPREIVWNVETDRPRLLVASEVYYPAGWHAVIDGEPAPILRANHLLRAVYVPAGRHIVTMRFDPESHERGVFISALASLLVYLGVAVLAGLLWYRRGHSA